MCLCSACITLFYKDMLKSNVKVYFYKEGFLHSKLMIFDDSLTLIGSANFDSRSFEQNFEVEAFIYDAMLLIKQLIFLGGSEGAEQQHLKDWIKRPVSKRFIESLMRLCTSSLVLLGE